MGRLKGFLMFAVTTTMLVKADDGWKRLLELNTAQENRSSQWARSSNVAGENRVPFVPEDIAMPPPWLLPLQQPQVNFPIAQAQVRSFFDEEVVEWPPRSPKTASQHLPEPSQHPKPPPPVIHTTLQPPRRQWTDATIRPVQHLWIEGDRQSTSQRPATRHATTIIKLRDLATPVTQRAVDVKKVEPKDSHRTSQTNEPKSEQASRQNNQQQTASRKSVISSYDSSEYDYDEGVVISSGHQHNNKRVVSPKIDHGQLERDQDFYDSSLTEVDATMSVTGGQDKYYAKPPVQQQSESRRQPQATSTEDADVQLHQAFDYSKTIFRTAVNSVKNSQQQFPHTPTRETVKQRENGRPAAVTYVDEETEAAHQPVKAKQGQQPGVRKQQQQRHQQKSPERNTSPPEVAVFEAERPIFYAQNEQEASPNQRQFDVDQHHRQQLPAFKQKAAEWTPRHPPTVDSNRKNKPRNPQIQHPEEQHQYPSENFNSNIPRYKTNNPVVHPVQQYQEERQDPQFDPHPPYHHQPPPYRPEEEVLNYDQPEEQHRLKEYHRPKEHHQPIYDYQDGQQNGKKSQRPRRPPIESRPALEFDPQSNNPWLNHQNQPEEISYDPYEQQNQDAHREHEHQSHEQEEEEERRPQEQQTEEPLPIAAPFPGGRRPPGGRPPFQSSEQFNGADNNEKGNNDDEFNSPGPFKAPPPHRPHHQQPNNRQRPHRPQSPSHQRPKDASIVTQGLNTLKSLVGLQTSQQRHRPHHSFNANRPGGHRPLGDRRRPPQQHQEGNSFGEIGRQDEEISDEFGPSDFNNFPVQTRQNLQSANDEPMEHRSDPEDEIQDIVPPPPVSTTESSMRVTAPPTRPSTEAPELSISVSSTVATEETKSTLFPPFNKRVRPQPPSPAQTENKANAGKDSPVGQLRITSYKQRIEAMKERAKLREQLALSKKDTEVTAELSPESVSSVAVSISTTTTTARPSTTRPKIPPRMPVRRPVTSGPSSSTTSSTTETVPLLEKVDKVQEPKDSNYEQYKRRFKPKSSLSRPSQKEEEIAAPPAEESQAVKSDTQEDDPSSRKNLFGKIPGSPFVRRRIQQKQQREEEELLLLSEENPKAVVKDSVKEEMPPVPISPFRPNKRIRPANFGRTTTAPPMIESSLNDEDEAVLASPDQWPPTSEPQAPVKTKMSIAEEKGEESHQIELASVAPQENKDSDNHQPNQTEEDRDFPALPSFGAETSGQSFLDKPDVSSERMETEMEEGDVQEKPRHSFFTMATHDPILPIEELLNIRVRDNGKDM